MIMNDNVMMWKETVMTKFNVSLLPNHLLGMNDYNHKQSKKPADRPRFNQELHTYKARMISLHHTLFLEVSVLYDYFTKNTCQQFLNRITKWINIKTNIWTINLQAFGGACYHYSPQQSVKIPLHYKSALLTKCVVRNVYK
jgi:hypothetical protein